MLYAYSALAGLQLAGGFQSADIIRQNGDLQASISNMNAQFAEVDAHDAIEAGYTNAARYQDVVDQAVAKDRGDFATQGVTIGYGTAGAVEGDNHIAGLVNTLQMQRAARDAAMGYQGQAINMRLGGQMTQLQSGLNASSAQTSGIYSALSTLGQGLFQWNLAGKGRDSTTGSDAQPGTQMKPVNMHLSSDGSGFTASPTWHADPGEPGPGFFGHTSREYNLGGEWSPMAADGDAYWNTLGYRNRSFTDETGG